jgi:protein TonB
VRYIPPPNPTRPPPAVSGERVHYVFLAAGDGIGPGIATLDPDKAFTTVQGSSAGGEVVNDTTPPDTASLPSRGVNLDSIYTLVDVDSAVVRLQTSAAPAYPLDLLQKHVEGTVMAQYVVDTTGFADTTSFRLLHATDSGFVRAVLDALPYMRFIPAKIGTRHVRQLVQQTFAFRISPSLLASPIRGKKP